MAAHRLQSSPKNPCRSFYDLLLARYCLAFMTLLGIINLYAMRSNLNVAITAMVKKHESTNLTECPVPNATHSNSTYYFTGEFDWDLKLQGIVKGAFYYGYVLTEIPGGRLAEKYGGKWVFGIGTLTTAIFTLLTPEAARLGVWYLIALRILMGFCEGVTKPSMFQLLSKWAPPLERSQIYAIVVKGNSLGTLIASPIAGALLNIRYDNGWPFVFYFFGVCGVVWFVFWAFLVYDTPSQHPRITPEERHYIESSLADSTGDTKKIPISWIAICTSIPFWAVLIGKFGLLWGKNVILIETPSYFSNALHFSSQESAYLTTIPHIGDFIFGMGAAVLIDHLRRKRILKTGAARKINNTIGTWIPAACFIALAFVGCNRIAAVSLLVIGSSFTGIGESGSGINHVDISPNFAGTLYGITNSISQLSGIGSPYLTGYLTQIYGNDGWDYVFYIAAGIFIVSSIFYLFCASGKVQYWNNILTAQSLQDEFSSSASKDLNAMEDDHRNGSTINFCEHSESFSRL